MPTITTIGERIRLFRLFSGFTQQRAALLVGLTQRQFATLERTNIIPRPKVMKAIQDFCIVVGVRSEYIVRGNPPAIEVGWLYYELPPKTWQDFSRMTQAKYEYKLTSVIARDFRNFLIDHNVTEYRVGDAQDKGVWFVYPIAPDATFVLSVSREFLPSFDELHQHLRLKKSYEAPLLDEIRPFQIEPGMDLRYLDQIIEVHKKLGIGPMTKLWQTVRSVAKDIISPEEAKRREAVRRMCIEILKLGIDPAELLRELDRMKREQTNNELLK